MSDFIKISIRTICNAVFSLKIDWKNIFGPFKLHFKIFVVFRFNMVFTIMVVRTKLVSISTVGNNNRKKKYFKK